SIPPLSPPPDACLPPPPREALEETEGDGAEPVRGPEDDFLLLLTHAEQQAQISQVQELAPEERREEGAALREGHCDAGPEVQGGAVDVSGVPDGVLSGFACCGSETLAGARGRARARRALSRQQRPPPPQAEQADAREKGFAG
ncbi:unnamed protein product, partial [Prorocentrum cordatum]